MLQLIRKGIGLTIAVPGILIFLFGISFPMILGKDASNFIAGGIFAAGGVTFYCLGIWLFRYSRKGRKLLYISLTSMMLAIGLLFTLGIWVNNTNKVSLRDIPGISHYSLSKNGILYQIKSISSTSVHNKFMFDITPVKKVEFKQSKYKFIGSGETFNEVVREFSYITNHPSISGNIISSTKEWGIGLIKGLYQMVRHPIYTAKGLGSLIKQMPHAIVSSVSPEEWRKWYRNKVAEKAKQYHIDPNAIVLDETRTSLEREVDIQIGTINTANLISLIVPGAAAGKVMGLFGEAAEEGGAVAETASVAEKAAEEGKVAAKVGSEAENTVEGESISKTPEKPGLQPSKELGKNLEETGKPCPGSGYDAHHIVAFDSPRAAEAREILKKFGVDVNSGDNGVWLPGEEGAGPGAIHPRIHTARYYEEVNRLLRACQSREEVQEVLKNIGEQLSKGTLPY